MRINNTCLNLSARCFFLCAFLTCLCLPVLAIEKDNLLTETRQSKKELQSDKIKSITAYKAALEKYHGILADYRRSIMAIEDTHGVYDHRLIEPLTGYGLAQKAQSDHFGAIETLRRTEHLIRVNRGLYHLNQLPLLNELVDSYGATGNWDMAGRTRLHMLQIEKHNYQRNDPRLLASVDNLMNWYLYHYKNSRGLESIQIMLKARKMNIELIDLLETEHSRQKRRLAMALDALAEKAYLLGQYRMSRAAEGNPSLSTLNMLAANSPDSKGLGLLFFNPFEEGEKALQKRVELLDQIQGVTLNERVDALLRLGDWYLISFQKSTAIAMYQKAFELTADNQESTSRLNFLFSHPRALHFDPFYASNNAPVKLKRKQHYVDFVFEVTGVGKTRKIQILDSDSVKIKDKDLHKMMLAARFRPRMVGSELVATEGVTYRYRY